MKDVQQTSITAYNEEVRSGKIPSQRRRVEWIIKSKGPLTRREIRDHCKHQYYDLGDRGPIKAPKIPMASVCGRVRALIDSNLIHVCDTKIDPETGKMVQLLAHGPQPKLNGNQYEFKI